MVVIVLLIYPRAAELDARRFPISDFRGDTKHTRFGFKINIGNDSCHIDYWRNLWDRQLILALLNDFLATKQTR